MTDADPLRSAVERQRQWTLEDLIKQWREQATFTPGNLYEQGRAAAFDRCADELEAALAVVRAPQPPEPTK